MYCFVGILVTLRRETTPLEQLPPAQDSPTMRLIIIGCEYAGKTTLASEIEQWMEQSMGSCTTSFHDHFLPWDPNDTSPKKERIDVDMKLLALDEPQILEKYMRYVTHYHTQQGFYKKPDHCVVNWYYGDAVYGPLYYGFGGAGERGDRQVMARKYDELVMEFAPDTVLVLVKASADVIRRRRLERPQPQPYPEEQDIELVLDRFDEEFERSPLKHRIVLDTSATATPRETLDEFARQIPPLLTDADQARMQAHAQQ